MYFYFIIFAMDRFENLQVKKEEQKRDPRIIKIIKTNNINGLEMEFNSLFLRKQKPSRKLEGFFYFIKVPKVYFSSIFRKNKKSCKTSVGFLGPR